MMLGPSYGLISDSPALVSPTRGERYYKSRSFFTNLYSLTPTPLRKALSFALNRAELRRDLRSQKKRRANGKSGSRAGCSWKASNSGTPRTDFSEKTDGVQQGADCCPPLPQKHMRILIASAEFP